MMKCPKCHADNPETQLFCGACGTRMGGHVPGTCPPDPGRPNVTETMAPPQEELATGTTFAGRYHVIEELGHGGVPRSGGSRDSACGSNGSGR